MLDHFMACSDILRKSMNIRNREARKKVVFKEKTKRCTILTGVALLCLYGVKLSQNQPLKAQAELPTKAIRPEACSLAEFWLNAYLDKELSTDIKLTEISAPFLQDFVQLKASNNNDSRDYKKDFCPSFCPQIGAGFYTNPNSWLVGKKLKSASPQLANYDYAVKLTFVNEGVWTPSDSNGYPNKFGINQAYYNPPKGYPKHVSGLTKQQAYEYYRLYYWQPLKLDKKDYPEIHKAFLFDAAVQHGTDYAQKLDRDCKGNLKQAISKRKNHIKRWVARNPQHNRLLVGMLRRVNKYNKEDYLIKELICCK